MNLSGKNRDLILALQEDPLASYVKLSQKMNITPATAKSRLKQLWAQDENEAIVGGIAGNLDPQKIKLSTTTFLLDMDSDLNNLKKLFDLFNYHPYTYYQNRIFGSYTGFLVQFNIPLGFEKQMSTLFSNIEDELGISRIEKIYNSDLVVNTYPDVSLLSKNNWEFDFYEWFENSSNQNDGNGNGDQVKEEDTKSDFLDHIELGHIIVVRELSMNGRRKQSKIMSDIQKNDQYNDVEKELFHESNQREVSRYFDFINRHKLISDYQLLFNRSKLGLYHQFCFTGELKNGYKQKFVDVFQTTPSNTPFRMGLSFKENRYFIYLEASPTVSNQAMDFIQSVSRTMNTMVLDGSFRFQRNYPVWHRNFISLDKGWKWNTSKQWMIDLPITNTLN